MKDFDAERRSWSVADRTFILGGETFVARERLRPETLAEFEAETVLLPDEERTLHRLLAATDQAFLAMVEGGDDESAGSARTRYLALRADPEAPVDLDLLGEVTRWLFEQHTGRPTEPSSPSGTGRDGTSTTSTGTSSPQAEPEPTASLSVS